MKWERLNDSSIICNDYRIGKFTVNGKVRYASYHAHTSLGFFDTAAEAKAAAESHLLSLPGEDTGH